ncbi:hypothetical protein COY07_03190 [Candidatus Peregrinibacteria bacterium CG_4_10_14_0_2_um_filter_43_11]|nr:MAG: hypothetical protein COY07_03190 [Candidatus Peregrinibacteria bacterium CG_4_10_14_0_2_um_filter_43_11]
MQTILQIIGKTPLIELKNITQQKNVRLFAKWEGANPSGSIKDRTAIYS